MRSRAFYEAVNEFTFLGKAVCCRSPQAPHANNLSAAVAAALSPPLLARRYCWPLPNRRTSESRACACLRRCEALAAPTLARLPLAGILHPRGRHVDYACCSSVLQLQLSPEARAIRGRLWLLMRCESRCRDCGEGEAGARVWMNSPSLLLPFQLQQSLVSPLRAF